MKYYSEITKKFYDDIEELKKDEITTEENNTKKENCIKVLRNKLDDAYKEINSLTTKHNETIKMLNKEYRDKLKGLYDIIEETNKELKKYTDKRAENDWLDNFCWYIPWLY